MGDAAARGRRARRVRRSSCAGALRPTGARSTSPASPGGRSRSRRSRRAAVLDGSSLEVRPGFDAMIEIEDQRYVEIEASRSAGSPAASPGTMPIGHPRDRVVRSHHDRRQHDARHGHDVPGPDRGGRARHRRVRQPRGPSDRRRRDPSGTSCFNLRARVERGARGQRQRHRVHDRGQPGPRHEQHRRSSRSATRGRPRIPPWTRRAPGSSGATTCTTWTATATRRTGPIGARTGSTWTADATSWSRATSSTTSTSAWSSRASTAAARPAS